MKRFDPTQIGWRIGRAWEPRAGELWCPWDRTAGVIGPQGSGKTLDLLTPALLNAPGAALVTLTKPDDLLLTITDRSYLIYEGKVLTHGTSYFLINDQEARQFYLGERFEM